MSVAFLRGHVQVARAVLDIVEAQYSPVEKEDERFHMERSDSEDSDEDSDDLDSDSDSEPRIVSRTVDKKFTIENVGEMSMQIKSRTRPLEVVLWSCPTFKIDSAGNVTNCKDTGILRFVISNDDQAGLKTLLDWGVEFASHKLEGDDDQEASDLFTFPDNEFQWAVENGKTQMLGQIIKRTGAGIPLEHLVKKSGVEMKEKPKYYQGLTVYGKKRYTNPVNQLPHQTNNQSRKDWANAGRNLVVRATGMKIPPLLHATLAASIESVEWFLGDTPFRHYNEFGQSKAALTNSKLKHLSQIPGGFERAVGRWLSSQSTHLFLSVFLSTPDN